MLQRERANRRWAGKHLTGAGSAGTPVRLYEPNRQPLEAGACALGTVAADDAGTTAGTTAGRTGWHHGAQRIADTAGTVTLIAVRAAVRAGVGLIRAGRPGRGRRRQRLRLAHRPDWEERH